MFIPEWLVAVIGTLVVEVIAFTIWGISMNKEDK